ncbi:hypothetical protein CF326_g8723 [Tilletia indica]|nr:hypothetical protein CF326_g8723 [Tilletia indica]
MSTTHTSSIFGEHTEEAIRILLEMKAIIAPVVAKHRSSSSLHPGEAHQTNAPPRPSSSSLTPVSRPYSQLLADLHGSSAPPSTPSSPLDPAATSSPSPGSSSTSTAPKSDLTESSSSPTSVLPQCPQSSPPYTSSPEPSSLSTSSIAARLPGSPSPSSKFARSFYGDDPPSTPSARSGSTSTRSSPAINFRRSSGLAAAEIGDHGNAARAGPITSALVALRRIGCEWSRARGWILRDARERDMASQVESPLSISMPLSTRSAMLQDSPRSSVPSSELRSPPCTLSDTTSVLTSVLQPSGSEQSTAPITPPTSSPPLTITSERGMEVPFTRLSLPPCASSDSSPTLSSILQPASPTSPPLTTNLIAPSSTRSPSARLSSSLAGSARLTILDMTLDRVGAAWVFARRVLSNAASGSANTYDSFSARANRPRAPPPSAFPSPASRTQGSISSPTALLSASSTPPPTTGPVHADEDVFSSFSRTPLSVLGAGGTGTNTTIPMVAVSSGPQATSSSRWNTGGGGSLQMVTDATARVRTAWMRTRASLLIAWFRDVPRRSYSSPSSMDIALHRVRIA